MNAQTQRFSLQGAAGALECALDLPEATPRGLALIGHPHPLFGGTMDNKVVHTLTRAFVALGYAAVRMNFRGVGASEGAYDEGVGETDDMAQLLTHMREQYPDVPFALAGFSFGAFVTSNAFAMLHVERELDALVLVGVAASRFNVAPIPAEAHLKTLVIHGEQDDTVPLTAALDWARPQILPVTVIPGVGHFFHGQLPLLKSLVVRHLGQGPV